MARPKVANLKFLQNFQPFHPFIFLPLEARWLFKGNPDWACLAQVAKISLVEGPKEKSKLRSQPKLFTMVEWH